MLMRETNSFLIVTAIIIIHTDNRDFNCTFNSQCSDFGTPRKEPTQQMWSLGMTIASGRKMINEFKGWLYVYNSYADFPFKIPTHAG